MYSIDDLESAIAQVVLLHRNDSQRLGPIADLTIRMLKHEGLPGARGGAGGELVVQGLARPKGWDVAYEFAGKFRLLISLKSLWKNASGVVPNRLDDLIGEVANVQQLRPELVSGYVILFDIRADSRRQKDQLMWSEFFERGIESISIRKAPLWNQGLLEGNWFIRFDGAATSGSRVVDPTIAMQSGQRFVRALIDELRHREPAVPFELRQTPDL